MLKFIMLFVVGFINYWVGTRFLLPILDFGPMWQGIFIIAGLATVDILYVFWVFGGLSADGFDFDLDIGGCDGGCDGGD